MSPSETAPSATQAPPAPASHPVRPSVSDEAIRDLFESRAADVDAGRAGVREGIAFLSRSGFADTDVEAAARLISIVARSDLASAFSAWAHRMVLSYVATADPRSDVRGQLPHLAGGALLGSTALAPATARQLAGTPIPLTYRRDGDGVRLDGRINWASNLIPPYLCVTAAASKDDPADAIVVAFRDTAAGLSPATPPRVLALQATGSTSLRLEGVHVSRGWILSDDLPGFLGRVLPGFLLLQTAFCRGLAERALEEAEASLTPTSRVVQPDLERLRSELDSVTAQAHDLTRAARPDAAAIPVRELLELRLRAAGLAGEAVRLELVTAGGRGYLADSGTARRLREAAFLPVQAPTEVMLRWILSRSA
jgi:alkylation response protein AidB-like acyl-CoA dehydrogenase